MNNKLGKIIVKNIKPILLFSALIIGILLISMSGRSTSESEKENNESHDNFSKLEVYTSDVEKRLESIISSISGAGSARVMVSFESSFESVYASDARLEENIADNVTQGAKTTEKQMVLASDRTNGETPVLLKELCPRVKGVIVVCSGGNNERVCREVKEAVTALFGISETKVFVTAGENTGNK